MIYAEFVKKEFGAEYVFEIGDWVVTTKERRCLAHSFEKGTRVKIVDVSGMGYDLMDEYGNIIIETGWDCVSKEAN